MKKNTLLSVAGIASIALVSLALQGCGDGGTPAAKKVDVKPIKPNPELTAPKPPAMGAGAQEQKGG